MFESVLVANRGEIAVRVFRTCRRLGIRSIGVVAEPDRASVHAAEADAVVEIGGPLSYLDANAILAAARASGARAIHPGYGFLAENATFAEACLAAGLAWVGPPPAAMRALGDKSRAKALAERIGVPVLPGYHGDDQSAERLTAAAAAIGFPVLIKAAAGGGGRGMRVVERDDDLLDAIEAARREALASFGDDRVLLERFIARPRHVEVQILGDLHGGLVHLGERECSVQRRHQKLIEESPSPAVNPALRDRMGQAALALAREAGYANVGTVEFLLDVDGTFAFLEVNARLQVEHPVTELVTGLDLVELQLSVAAGQPLPFTQYDISLKGHAVEARLIAEDPLTGFLPSVGRLDAFSVPPGVRLDTGVRPGSTISPYYDSLLAKLIAHGEDRDAAITRLRDTLRESEVSGVSTNLDLLLATVEHPAFRSGDLATQFLVEHRVVDDLAELPPQALAAASAHAVRPRGGDPWRALGPWRLSGVEQPVTWEHAGREYATFVTRSLDRACVSVRVGDEHFAVPPPDGDQARIGRGFVEWRGRTYRLRLRPPPSVDEHADSGRSAGGGGYLSAPMPGKVVKLLVSADERVRQGQPLVVLEAMKMEHVVGAPHAGRVASVHVKSGDLVKAAAPLIELIEDE